MEKRFAVFNIFHVGHDIVTYELITSFASLEEAKELLNKLKSEKNIKLGEPFVWGNPYILEMWV